MRAKNITAKEGPPDSGFRIHLKLNDTCGFESQRSVPLLVPHNCWVTPLQRFEETGGPTERFWNRKATSQRKFYWLCKLKVIKNQTFEHGDNAKYFTLMSRHERNDFETEIWSEKTQFWNLGTLEVAQKFKTTFQITIEIKHELLITLMTRLNWDWHENETELVQKDPNFGIWVTFEVAQKSWKLPKKSTSAFWVEIDMKMSGKCLDWLASACLGP